MILIRPNFSRIQGEVKEVGGVAYDLGGAALSITPFLGRFFELRNEALLAEKMGLREYSYIYAVAYHDHLLSAQTRNEIFSDGNALSLEASLMLRDCLVRQLAGIPQTEDEEYRRRMVEAELDRMDNDDTRLIWQDNLPEALHDSLVPYRHRLDQVFCRATAGLEMEENARRALWVAIE